MSLCLPLLSAGIPLRVSPVLQARCSAPVSATPHPLVCVLSVQAKRGLSAGPFIVSGSRDKTIKVWDVAAGVCLFTLVSALVLVELSFVS